MPSIESRRCALRLRASNLPRLTSPTFNPVTAQDPADAQFDVEKLALQKLASNKKGSAILASHRFGMNRAVPSHPQQLGDPACIFPVGLHRHSRERRLHVPRRPISRPGARHEKPHGLQEHDRSCGYAAPRRPRRAGSLSELALGYFTLWFMQGCIDQVTFMSGLL